MSVQTKMTAIADKIRSLLGLTGTMGLDSMATNLETVNSEVSSQTELIEQIITALDGKSAGSGITPTGTVEITENGTHDVENYENVEVDVETGVFPSGTLEITENGEFNVNEYSSVNVNVAAETNSETWTFTMEDGSTVTKEVVTV